MSWLVCVSWIDGNRGCEGGGKYQENSAGPDLVCGGISNVNVWFGPAMFEPNGTSRGQPPW